MLPVNMSRYADFHKQRRNLGLCVCVGCIGLDPRPVFLQGSLLADEK